MKNYNTKYSKILTKNFLLKEYMQKKRNSRQIAKILDCNAKTVLYYLKKYNIKIRTRGEAHIKYNITKEFLIKEYSKNEKSTYAIARIIGCSQAIILYYMKKFNIRRRTLSEAFKGIHKSLKTEFKKGVIPNTCFKKGHKLNKGKNNPMFGVHKFGKDAFNWQGGKSFEPYPIEWNKTFKSQIRKRDNYTCQKCGITEGELIGFHRKLSVHHIDYNKENLNPNNLISLCRNCHLKTNGNRDYWFAYFRYIMEEI